MAPTSGYCMMPRYAAVTLSRSIASLLALRKQNTSILLFASNETIVDLLFATRSEEVAKTGHKQANMLGPWCSDTVHHLRQRQRSQPPESRARREYLSCDAILQDIDRGPSVRMLRALSRFLGQRARARTNISFVAMTCIVEGSAHGRPTSVPCVSAGITVLHLSSCWCWNERV